MKKLIKVDHLEGPALDWAVLKVVWQKVDHMVSSNVRSGGYNPRNDSKLSSTLIDTYLIATQPRYKGNEVWEWDAFAVLSHIQSKKHYESPSRVVAAMRALVGALHGDAIEIPEEFL